MQTGTQHLNTSPYHSNLMSRSTVVYHCCSNMNKSKLNQRCVSGRSYIRLVTHLLQCVFFPKVGLNKLGGN